MAEDGATRRVRLDLARGRGTQVAAGVPARLHDTIMGQADGQPGWSKPWFYFWTNIQHPYAVFFAYLVAVLETLIALALIIGFARKITYVAAIVFSVLIWATAEGFGGPYTSGSSDIGTAIIYALVFAALLSFGYYQGTAPYSVDEWLERRISWWHRVAEVGAHNHEARPRTINRGTPTAVDLRPEAPGDSSYKDARPTTAARFGV